MKSIILLERAQDVFDAISWAEENDGEVIFISFHPEVSWVLDKKEILYKTPSSYIDYFSILDHGHNSFGTIQNLSSYLDENLFNEHGFPQLHPAEYAFYDLKMLWDALFTSIMYLESIISREKPEYVRCYSPVNCIETRYAFRNGESIYSSLLKLNCWKLKIEIIETQLNEICVQTKKGLNYELAKKLRGYINDIDVISLYNFFQKEKLKKNLNFFKLRKKHYSQSLLLYSGGYNWDSILSTLNEEKDFDIIRVIDQLFSPSPSLVSFYQRVIEQLIPSYPDWLKIFSDHSENLSSLLSEKTSLIIGRATAEAITAYPIMVQLIHEYQVKGVLLSIRESAIGHALVQAAHDCKIPVISWQHGGAGYCYHPMMTYIESINSDVHMTFGDGVTECYKNIYQRLNIQKIPEIVSVGSSNLDLIRNETSVLLNKDICAQKTVLYITTHYYSNHYAISAERFDPNGINEKLWAVQKAVLDLAKKHSEYQLIVKLHPSHTSMQPLSDYAEHHKIKNVQFVVNSPTLRSLLDHSDIVIFDLISTGILEVLLTNKPVFLYSGVNLIEEKPLSYLKKRANVYDSVEDMSVAIDSFLSGNFVDNSADCNDNTFISKFGTHLNDGRSIERALKIVDQIVN